MVSRTQFEQDALVQLGYDRYTAARPQLGRLYERVQRDDARRAIATQQMLDASVEQRYGFGQLRRAAGLGASSDANPWMQFVDSAGRFHLPTGIERGLFQMGFDRPAITAMEQLAAKKLGTYAEQQKTFQEGLGRASMPTALAGDQTTPDVKYAESKRQLFLRVQEALTGAQDDEAKRRILRVAFGGPGGQELLAQFGSQAEVEANTGQAQPGLAGQVTEAAKSVGSGVATSFGQLMGALGAPGDLVRSSLGVLMGAKDEQGQDLTKGDIGESALNLLRAIPNIGTLGGAGATFDALRINESAPGLARIAETADPTQAAGRAGLTLSPLMLAMRKLRQTDAPGARGLSSVLGFAGDVATDPLSYVTFGAGGVGSQAATRVVGSTTGKLAQLLKLGVELPEAGRIARAGHAAFEGKLAQLTKGVSDDLVKQAAQEASAASIRAETIHHALGFKGYKNWLGEKYGANADELFPKSFVGGTKADLLASAARGGISLRAGRFGGINLREGTGALRGIRPLTAWGLDPTNVFTKASSKTLDEIADTFHFGAGKGRAFTHLDRGLFNATMGEGHKAGAIDAKGRDLREGIVATEEGVRRAFRNVDDAGTKIISLIEEGSASRYAALPEVTPKVMTALEKIRADIDAARELALANGVDIPLLRELTDPSNADKLPRYFPHKVKTDHMLEIRRSRRGPDIVSPAHRRELRAGALLEAPSGAWEKLQTGFFSEIQDVTRRLYGAEALIDDPFFVAKSYIASVTHAAAVNKLFTSLAERGLIVPASAEQIANLAPTQGLVGGADNIRSIWAKPEEEAAAALGKAQQARAGLQEDLAILWEKRADTLERRAQQNEMLDALADRKAMHDAGIEALRLSVKEKDELRKLAQRAHRDAKADAVRQFKAEKRQTLAELRANKADQAEISKAMGQLGRNRTATLKAIDERYAAQVDNLKLTPEGVRKRLEAEIRAEALKARANAEPFLDVRNRIAQIRNRIAQLESDELAKVTHDRMLREAFAAVKGRHGAVLAKQRSREAIAADLNDRIALAQDRLAEVRRASGNTEAIERELEGLIVNRQRVLEAAEREGAEVGELAEALSAAEGAMRLADLREAQQLAATTSATFEIGRGMSTKIALPIARLLGYHAADLAREARHMLAYSPRLRFLERAATDYDRATLGALGSAWVPISEGFDSVAANYARGIVQRGDEILDSWAAAIGGADHAYDEAVREYSRQMSAIIARESELAQRLARMEGADPITRAVATADNDLNFFTSELDRDVAQLEAWIDVRSDIRKTMTTTSLAARAAMRENDKLRKAIYTAQRTMDVDIPIAIEAASTALSDARVFRLMTPQIEHLSAVVGKVPFIDSGYAVPKEVMDVADRLLNHGEAGQRDLVKVLGLFNSMWKRGVLLTPGSVVRRVFGNVYNAVVLAGVGSRSFERAFDAYSFLKGAKSLSDIADPTSRRYMELALEHNLFEGQTTALAQLERGFKTGVRHPVQSMEKFLFTRALRGEDMARLAQFIEGLERGMSPEAARLWTGKYHFFNHELTDRERRIMRPLYPFYAYIRNNTALQFYTLFHNPGRIGFYGHAMESIGQEPTGEQEPSWLVQQGGFPIGGNQFLQNTLVDTSPLAALHNLAGFEQEGPGTGFQFGQSDFMSSASPIFGAINTMLTGVDPLTGQDLDEIGASSQPTGPLAEALKALGITKPDGSVNARAESALGDLFPLLARANRLFGGGTPSQQEQYSNYLSGVLLGPNTYTNTTRAQNAATRQRLEAIEAILSADPNRLKSEDVNRLAEERRVREQIEMLLSGR